MFTTLRVLTAAIHESYSYGGTSRADSVAAGVLVIFKGLLAAGYGIYAVCNAEKMVKRHLHWVADEEATPSEGAILRNKIGGVILIVGGVVCIVSGVAILIC